MSNGNSQPEKASSGCSNTNCCPPKQNSYQRTEAKIGRNDPCPCGNGLKYKKCCGRNV